jgi:hypothetical protein
MSGDLMKSLGPFGGNPMPAKVGGKRRKGSRKSRKGGKKSRKARTRRSKNK